MINPITFNPASHHVRKDKDDDRDHRFAPSKAKRPDHYPIDGFIKMQLPVLDQGQEHACTGFGLATAAHFLMHKRGDFASLAPVSARMLYEMAKRYDGGPDPHEGSTARAAIKGWHKNGVCSDTLWPYKEDDTDHALTDARKYDAMRRPLGAYQRVDKDDEGDLRAAIAEFGIVYVTSEVHEGWHHVAADGVVPYKGYEKIGAHAFALIGYDRDGFWFQNSKGPHWGRAGLGYLDEKDWRKHGMDAWVVELA